MITVKRHSNLDNWINVSLNGKIFRQLTSRAKAMKIAKTLGRIKGVRVLDLDEGEKHLQEKV